ncbi:hypothetical protein OWT26_16460 [Burkholderia sp. 1A5]
MSGGALGGPGRGAGMLTAGCVTVALLAAGLASVAALGARGTVSAGDARIVAIVFTCIVLWATGAVASLWVSLLFSSSRRPARRCPPPRSSPASGRARSGSCSAARRSASR